MMVFSGELIAQENHQTDSSFYLTHPTTGEITPEDIRENQLLRESVVREHNALIFVIIVCVLLFFSLMLLWRLYHQQKIENRKLQVQIHESQHALRLRAEKAEQAYDKLTIVNATLENKYNAQQEQLLHFQHEAEANHNEFERFLTSSSYYFASPLSSLKGLIQVARLVRESGHIGQLETLFSKMDITLRLIDNMIQKLLMLERIKSRQLESEKVDFEILIQELKYKYLSQIKERQLSFQYQVNTKEVILFPIEVLKIILDNLYENSITFTQQQRHPYIFTKIEYEENEIILKVSDNGVGVPQNYTEKIYEMYYRASELSTGCGLGLYVVKVAVEKYKGRITLESISGRFTEFTIKLPIYHL